MISVLGIDAAWTATKPSGVALISRSGDSLHCVAVARCYEDFVRLAGLDQPVGFLPAPVLLAGACNVLLNGKVLNVVAVDMPLSDVPITGRRTADNALSSAYGGRGCGTHSPSTTRPGLIGATLREGFAGLGYPLITMKSTPPQMKALIEVYPHPALLTLLMVDRRIPYKVSRCRRYWPNTTVQVRIESLLIQMQGILAGLKRKIEGISLELPSSDDVTSLSQLKPYEDMLDALVCCWVGASFLEGNAEVYGDETAGIWVPKN
jgi:predicted RNase H-like nuclease